MILSKGLPQTTYIVPKKPSTKFSMFRQIKTKLRRTLTGKKRNYNNFFLSEMLRFFENKGAL